MEICKDPPEAENGFGTTERGSGAGLLQEMGSGEGGWTRLARFEKVAMSARRCLVVGATWSPAMLSRRRCLFVGVNWKQDKSSGQPSSGLVPDFS